MDGLVKKIVSELDTKTKRTGTDRVLALMGDESSAYLRAVKRKAKQLGIDALWWDEPACRAIIPSRTVEVIWDHHIPAYKEKFETLMWAGYADLDHIRDHGPSCCAEACKLILRELRLDSRLITITGRGHARKGLVDILEACGHSTLGIHSSSTQDDIQLGVVAADAIVNTSERLIWPGECWPKIVLDASGHFPGRLRDRCRYIGRGDIGELNASVLLNRLVNLKGK